MKPTPGTRCMVCSRDADEFENDDPRRPFCTRHMSPVEADSIPYSESDDPLFDGDQQEQQARIQAWR